MPNAKVKNTLQTVVGRLDELRDQLFDCSKESLKTEGNGEEICDLLYNLAKSLESIRRQASFLMGNSLESAERTDKITKPHSIVRQSRKRKAEYPKYSVQGDLLIKTGLTRDKRKEYQQTVPRADFEKILSRLDQLKPGHSEVTPEQVQSVLECPIYQTYNVLLLLRRIGLLNVKRRGHYRFTSPDTLLSRSDAIWKKIELGEVRV